MMTEVCFKREWEMVLQPGSDGVMIWKFRDVLSLELFINDVE